MTKKKTKASELDVDYIGSQDPLTVEEQSLLAEYFRSGKNHKRKPQGLAAKKKSKKSRTAQ